jgi:hypothetical protein
LQRRFPEKAGVAQLSTTSAAFSGTLRFPFESPPVPFTAHLVFQPTVRQSRGNSINTWLAVHVTLFTFRVAPKLMIASFKELSGFLSLTWYYQKYRVLQKLPNILYRRIEH